MGPSARTPPDPRVRRRRPEPWATHSIGLAVAVLAGSGRHATATRASPAGGRPARPAGRRADASTRTWRRTPASVEIELEVAEADEPAVAERHRPQGHERLARAGAARMRPARSSRAATISSASPPRRRSRRAPPASRVSFEGARVPTGQRGRLRREGGRRLVPLHAVRGDRRAQGLPLLRRARATRSPGRSRCACRTAWSRSRTPPPRPRPRGWRARRRPLRADAAAAELPGRGRRGPFDLVDVGPSGRKPHADPARRAARPRRRHRVGTRVDAAHPGAARGLLRPALSLREARPGRDSRAWASRWSIPAS